ncbi:GNAT family N-acetyltransferase [Actinophytocola algeriensis]|uniref:Putative acetyltransferase n=1 Tax=Actinophytocola algeriensis TaxID=1768010 RepID=A0A7W7Q600_9PSEU|nr:GNAT family N-acetyltransferase [Actinophytocola algeriensis]MBB4907690.1 putative acetyltransferase [Actinophytocola algeriensis]MBE1479720.1 putative acetyltransferase [Actinophytocola algeriensis]
MALPALTLRPPGPGDEAEFRAAHEVMAREGIVFGLGLDGLDWPGYLRRLAEVEAGARLDGFVPATFLVAEAGGVIVGRTSIRHELNATLAVLGGHIGYCVLPARRGRGHAKEILRQSLPVARARGVTRALLTCDETNTASQKVIEHCGGVLESSDGHNRRYWIG